MTSIIHLIPSLAGGGAERQLAMLACEQQRRGLRVRVGTRTAGVHGAALQAAGVPVHLLGDHRGLNPVLFAKVRGLIGNVRPDIVQTWLPQMDVIGGMAALLRGVPWILSERASHAAFRQISATRWTRSIMGRRANAIVANSRAGAGYWQPEMTAGARVGVVANALDVAAIQAAPPLTPDPVLDGRPLILVVGRLTRQKATDVVVEAVAQVSQRFEFQVLFIGEGPMRALVDAALRAPMTCNRIAVVGYEPRWWGLLKSAIAVLSASRFEGQPNVVLEAMAGGCPLIVSDIPEHREILDEQSALIVAPEDPRALALAIENLLSAPAPSRERAQHAARRVGGLTIERAADAYDSIYGQVLSGRRH